MKFCPHCGAAVAQEKAVFCVECGQKLASEPEHVIQPAQEEPPAPVSAVRDSAPEEKNSKPVKKQKAKKKKKHKRSKKRSAKGKLKQVQDDGYDGYYEDVLPPDLDRIKEGLDKALVKNVIMLIIAVLLIICACVIMLYIL